MQPGQQGFSVYTKSVKNVKAGDTVDLAFSYKAPATAPTGTTTGAPASTTQNSVIPILLIVAAIVAGGVLIMSVRKKLAAKSAQADQRPAKASSARSSGAKPSSASARPAAAQRKAGGSSTPAKAADTSAEPATGLTGTAKRNLVTAVIVGVLVVAGIVLGIQGTKPKSTGDTVTKTFSQGEPCATATVALALPPNAETQATADQLFEALQPVAGGLNTATFNRATSSIDVGYCESKTTEDAVRAALAPTGMVAPGGGAPAGGAPTGGTPATTTP
jgi:hypothetical protein